MKITALLLTIAGLLLMTIQELGLQRFEVHSRKNPEELFVLHPSVTPFTAGVTSRKGGRNGAFVLCVTFTE